MRDGVVGRTSVLRDVESPFSPWVENGLQIATLVASGVATTRVWSPERMCSSVRG